MFKMPQPRHDHRQVMLAAIINRIIIPDGAARLYKSGNTGFMSQPHTIIEGEESITGHHGPLQVKIELLCFFQCLSQ